MSTLQQLHHSGTHGATQRCPSVAILADSIEHSLLARAALTAEGLEPAMPGAPTRSRLAGLPTIRHAVHSGFTVTSISDPGGVLDAADTLMADSSVGAVLLVGVLDQRSLAGQDQDAVAVELTLLSAWHDVPLLVQRVESTHDAMHDILCAAGIPVLPTVAEAVAAVHPRQLAPDSQRSS